MTTGTQAYALPGGHGFLHVISVEYPSGQSPPEYLQQVEERSAEFASGGDYYALRGIADSTAIASDTAQGTIVFAETVTTGENAVITYAGTHPIPAAASDQNDPRPALGSPVRIRRFAFTGTEFDKPISDNSQHHPHSH
jgi:hypothetical protein